MQHFFYRYPDIITDADNFSLDIYKKYEFQEVKSDTLLRHQKIVSRFMNGNTDYKSLLLYHGLGTGKTCSSIAISEKLHATKSIRKTLVITRGGAIEKQYIDQLVNVCVEPKNKYKHQQHNQLNKRIQQIRSKKLYGRFYEFTTYIKFAKRINKLKTQSKNNQDFIEKINLLFDRYLFIIDEAHNIRPNFDKTVNVYTLFHTLFHTINDKRLLLLTGTPIKDSIVEISYLMNLILPIDKQIPVGNQFVATYVNPDTQELYNNKLDVLKKQLIGYVSFFRSNFEDIQKKFVGETGIGTLSFFKIVPSYMSLLQTNSYTKALLDDKQKKGIFSHSRQASLMVDDHGNWGGKIDIKNILNHLKTLQSVEEKIQYIAQFSTKYATLLTNILDHPNDNIFIYNTFVKGSGLILFTKLMDAVGFYRTNNGLEKTKNNKRYAVITNELSNPIKTMNIINTFNSPNNVKGEYIRIIIGSRITSEGLTFKNVKHIHILTPFWNFTEIEQAIARTIRLYSHQALLDLGEKPIVNVYLHASIPKKIDNVQLQSEWDELNDLEKQLAEDMELEMNDEEDEEKIIEESSDEEELEQDISDFNMMDDKKKLANDLGLDSDSEEELVVDKKKLAKDLGLDSDSEDEGETEDEDDMMADLEKDLNDMMLEEEESKKKLAKNLGLDSDYDEDDMMADLEKDLSKMMLEEEEKVEVVQMDKHLAENLKKNLYSIDLYMYSISEKKDYQTKKIERILKEISFDCFLNSKNNNIPNGIDGSRECDYTSCIIKCNAKDTVGTEGKTVNFESYNILYDDLYKTKIEKYIQEFFLHQSKSHTNIKELTTFCNQMDEKIQEFQVKNVLALMILHSKYIKNNMGIENLINYANDDNIYLVYSQNVFDNFYFKNHWVQMDTNLNEFITNYLEKKDITIVKRIIESSDESEKMMLLQQISPQHIDEMIKSVITSTSTSDFKKWILQVFDTVIIHGGKQWYIVRNVLSPLQYDGTIWKQITSVSHPKDMDEMNELIRKRFGQPPLEYYAIYNLTTKSLLLRSTENLTVMRKGKGMECTSFTPGNLLTKIIIPGGINVPGNTEMNNKVKDKVYKTFTHDELEKFNDKQIKTIYNVFNIGKNDICKYLLEWFTQNKKLQITF